MNKAAPRNLEPRATPVQPRGARTLQAVLDAAHHILKTEGIDGLSTAAVARQSGMAVGTVYRLFPNKEAIVCKVYEDKIRQVRAIGNEIRVTFQRGDDWRAAVRTYIEVLKGAERSTDFDISLASAGFMIPEIRRIDTLHAIYITDDTVDLLKTLGSPWSDAALFELCMTTYCLETASWHYANTCGTPTATLADRLIVCALAIMEPAMRGDPEPEDGNIDRERLLASYRNDHK
ncbi:TetR/AcrR family transcriptional regulator [Novosphingobium sp.]|uniref:TetR/AcrR family transcriptional regulator n=1 Tax=Novosphingobium sp. TaxID=1874826 RepID=UPI003B527049